MSKTKFPEKDSWYKDVETHWHSTQGFFNQPPEDIAVSIKDSCDTLDQALKKIDLYVHIVSSKLDAEEKLFLEDVKDRLQGLYQH